MSELISEQEEFLSLFAGARLIDCLRDSFRRGQAGLINVDTLNLTERFATHCQQRILITVYDNWRILECFHKYGRTSEGKVYTLQKLNPTPLFYHRRGGVIRTGGW